MSWHHTKTNILQKGSISETRIEIYVDDENVFIRKNKSTDIPVDFDEFNLLILSRMKMLNIDIKLMNKENIKQEIQNEFIKNDESFKLNTLTLEKHIDNICNPKNIKGWGSLITPSYNQMDNQNKKIADIMATGNMKKAVEHMFKDDETGKELTYSEMRSRYG